MNNETSILIVTAVSLGLIHTLLGPDHYLPFIAMAKAGKWSNMKTCIVTFFSGLGHVGSSVVLGCIGALFGITISRLEHFEASRGSLAAWLLITFGLLYLIWGIQTAIRQHTPHRYNISDESRREQKDSGLLSSRSFLSPWVIFTIFVLGPCEPLIPVLMYPAAHRSWLTVALVSLVFAIVTVATMLGIVMAGINGLRIIRIRNIEKFSHALAGATVMCCGIGIRFLGL